MEVKRSVLGGVLWTSLSFGSRQVLQSVIGIFLARLLVPEMYGIVALATVAIGIMGLLRNTGLGAAIVRQPDITDEQVSSTFWFNNLVNATLTIALAALAPTIASLLHEPRTTLVLFALAPNFLLGGLSSVHGGLLSRRRDYKTLAVRETVGVALSGVFAIAAALAGAGLYALVLQSLASNLFALFFLWRTVAWRPTLHYRFADVRPMLAYGLPLGGSQVVQYLARNLDNLLVGRFLGAAALGLYAFAYGTLLVPLQVVQSILGRVMFPEMAHLQDDLPRVQDVYLGSVRYVSTLLWWPIGGLLVLAPTAIPFIYGPQWNGAIVLVQIFCLVAVTQVIGATVGWIYNSQGKTRLQFLLVVLFGLLIYAAFIVGLRWKVFGVTVGYAIVNFVCMWPFNAFAFRVIRLSTGRVLRALAIPFSALAAMVAALAGLQEAWTILGLGLPAALLATGAVLGTGVYAAVLWLLDRTLMRRILALPRDLMTSRRRPTTTLPEPK